MPEDAPAYHSVPPRPADRGQALTLGRALLAAHAAGWAVAADAYQAAGAPYGITPAGMARWVSETFASAPPLPTGLAGALDRYIAALCELGYYLARDGGGAPW